MAAAVATSTCAHCQREIPSSNIALHSAHCARNLQKCEHCGDMVPRKHMDEHYDENHAPVNCSLCKSTVERELWDLHKGIQCPQRMLTCQYCEFELPAADIFEHQDVCGNRTEYCQPCRKYIRLREWIGHEIQFHANSNVAAESSSDGTMLEKEERAAAAEQPVRPASNFSDGTMQEKEERAPAAEQPARPASNFSDGTMQEKEERAPAAEQPVRPASNFSDGTMLEKEERAPAAEQPVRPAHGSQRKQLLFTIAIAGIAILIGSILFQKKG